MAATDTTGIALELAQFRVDLRAWLASRPELAPDQGYAGRSAEELNEETLARGRGFQQALYDAGFVGMSLPVECGGRGLDRAFEALYREEVRAYELPTGMFNVGLGMVAPTLATHGTEAQRRRFLPPLLQGKELWAQLFSEPGAGSDLASAATRAVRDGDNWVVSGQKVWTSGGRYADWGLALVRSDPSKPKHRGITMLIIDMKAPGVEVRPLRQMTGHAKFDEVFLDGVVVPDDYRIGEVNGGWGCARTTLTAERGAVGRNTAQRGGSFLLLSAAAAEFGRDTDPVIRQRLVEVYSMERIASWLSTRAREARPGRTEPAGILAKLHAAALIRASSRLGADLAGPAAVAWEPGGDDQWALRLCAAPGLSIGGGTDEIVKNTIADRVLGLPREPAEDRNAPYNAKAGN